MTNNPDTLRKACLMVKPWIGVIPIHKEADCRFEKLSLVGYTLLGEGKTKIGYVYIYIL